VSPPSTPRPTYLRDGIVLGAAVGLFGVTFGVLAVAAGLTTLQACAMSLLVFTGASQFALVGVVGSGGSIAAALASSLLLASRNGIYGLALHPHLRGTIARRLLGAQFIIDESTAMALGQREEGHAEPAFWVAGLSVFVFWNLGTLAGAVGGNALGDPNQWGLDAAFPAGFIVLMRPHIVRRAGRIAAVAGALIALVSIPILPAGAPIVVGALGAAVALWIAGDDQGPASAPGDPS
jgi:4-azaleucine resistance transporter AzlC